MDTALANEKILQESDNRFVLFPIKHDKIWAMYKTALRSFWVTEEVDLSQDIIDWDKKLNDNERHFVKHVLGFFAASDGIVNENLVVNFMQDVTIPEVRCFLRFSGSHRKCACRNVFFINRHFYKRQHRERQNVQRYGNVGLRENESNLGIEMDRQCAIFCTPSGGICCRRRNFLQW
jgi:hypothetical protein